MAEDRQHHTGIDILKLLAAVAVIYLHAVGRTDLAWTSDPMRFAVPFFAASAAYLAFRSAIGRADLDAGRYVRSRISRIYIPFLLWTAVYLLVRVIWSLGSRTSLPDVGLALLWRGSAHHLWFLPFVLVVTVFAFAVARSLRGRGSLLTGAAVLFVGGVADYLLVTRLGGPVEYFLGLSSRNVPVVLWTLMFLCLARAKVVAPPLVRTSQRLALPAFLMTLLMLALTGRNVLIENLSGLVALGAALSVNIYDRAAIFKTTAGFAYGVYLCHILFVEGGQDVARSAGLSRGPVVTLCVFALALLGSFALCRLLALLPCAEALGVPRLRVKRQPYREAARVASDSPG